MPKIAVLTFPGNNCEVETVRALKNSGLDAEIFLWNKNANELKNFDGVVIPGGFSFEDRGRSGVLSAQEVVIKTLKKMSTEGTPILGICNGAQIVVESGLILEDEKGIPLLSLTRNERKNEAGEILGTGFYHNWVYLKPVQKNTPFSNFPEIFHVPVAHGEGKFLIHPDYEAFVKENNLVVFEYVNEKGEADEHYPINPNGSFLNAAALCNPEGNVVACMPHPERSKDGQRVFDGFAQFFNEQWALLGKKSPQINLGKREKLEAKKTDVEFFVSLKITDNTEKSFENLLKQKGHENIELFRGEKWSFCFKDETSLDETKERAKKIIQSHELLNSHKQAVFVKIKDNFYTFSKETGVEKSDTKTLSENSFIVHEKTDVIGQSKASHFQHLFPELKIESVSHGIFWEFKNAENEDFINTSLFASFVAEEIYSSYTN